MVLIWFLSFKHFDSHIPKGTGQRHYRNSIEIPHWSRIIETNCYLKVHNSHLANFGISLSLVKCATFNIFILLTTERNVIWSCTAKLCVSSWFWLILPLYPAREVMHPTIFRGGKLRNSFTEFRTRIKPAYVTLFLIQW